jgi:hypothetical protein
MEHSPSRGATVAPSGSRWRPLLLLAGDIVAIIIFAAIGRRSHGEAAGLAAAYEVLRTAAPFVLGWLLVAPFAGAFRSAPAGDRRTQLLAMARRVGLAWLLAWPVGLALRAFMLDRGIPISFAIVTLISNGIILGGWRTLFSWWESRRDRSLS